MKVTKSIGNLIGSDRELLTVTNACEPQVMCFDIQSNSPPWAEKRDYSYSFLWSLLAFDLEIGQPVLIMKRYRITYHAKMGNCHFVTK